MRGARSAFPAIGGLPRSRGFVRGGNPIEATGEQLH